jgi:quercetin dioxygenase-like cupin family protein
MKPTRLLQTGALLLLLAAASAVAGYRAGAAQQPAVQRTEVLRADTPGSTTHEAVMMVVQLAPGAAAPRHRHPGTEIGYLLDGSVVVEHEGRAPLTLKPGDGFINTGAHAARNPGITPAHILAVYLVEKGKPLAEPVP